MLNRRELEAKMEQRGFTVLANMGTKIHFLSSCFYPSNQTEGKRPVLNVIVNLDNGEFECSYLVPKSINVLKSPSCSPVMDDNQFDKIVGKLREQAQLLENHLGR